MQAMGTQEMQWIDRKLHVVGFKCSRCVEGAGREETMKKMEVEHVGMLERLSKFCYLGDMIGCGGGAEEASRARVWCAWASSENWHQF